MVFKRAFLIIIFVVYKDILTRLLAQNLIGGEDDSLVTAWESVPQTSEALKSSQESIRSSAEQLPLAEEVSCCLFITYTMSTKRWISVVQEFCSSTPVMNTKTMGEYSTRVAAMHLYRAPPVITCFAMICNCCISFIYFIMLYFFFH